MPTSKKTTIKKSSVKPSSRGRQAEGKKVIKKNPPKQTEKEVGALVAQEVFTTNGNGNIKRRHTTRRHWKRLFY